MALTRISSAGIQTSPTFSGDVKIGLGATFESTGNAYVTGITTLGIGATGDVYLYNPSNSALSGTQNSAYGWKAKTYSGGLQVNSTLYLSRSGSNGLSLNYNNATGSYITANSGFMNIQVPHGPPMRFYASCFEFHHNHNARQSAFFNTNGAVQLNHGGNKRFETTSTGAIITGIATVTGNLSIGGTVTYEDVSNVDSIGIVTARQDVHIGENIVHIGDTDTRIRFPTNDKISLEAGGTTRIQTTSIGAQVCTTLLLYGDAGNPGRLRLQEGGALSEIRVARNTDNNSFLFFDTEIGGTTATRMMIDNSGHFRPNVDSTNDLGITGTRWRNVYADNYVGGGGAFTGNLTFANNVGVLFGSGNPFQIFHNNGTSYISHNGSGQLEIRAKATEQGIKIFPDGKVELYNDNVLKFATSGIGATIYSDSADLHIRSGAVSATGEGNITFKNVDGNGQPRDVVRIIGASHGNGGYGELKLQTAFNNTLNTRLTIDENGKSTFTGNIDVVSTDAGSSAAPELKLYRNSASPADADYLGQIKFAGESDTGVERNYAKITGKILDASNGTEDGIIEFAHIKAGSQTITGRWRSDSLQLLNGTSLTVAGTIDGTGAIGSKLFQQDSNRNMIAGTNAGLAITVTTSPPPLSNILIGCCAGSRIRSQCYTVAIGVNAGKCIAGGSGQDTFVGSNAGQRAGCCGGTGSGNAFFGYGSGICGYNPIANTYLGYHAGRGHSDSTGGTGGTCNVAIGYHAASSIRGGNNNVLIGRYVGASHSTASNNIVFGNAAMFNTLSGGGNLALGSQVLEKNITGFLNVALSCNALYNNTTGACNIAIGHNALYCNTTFNTNIAIGRMAGYQATCGPNIMIGEHTGCIINGAQNTIVGQNAGKQSTEATGNSFFGQCAGYNNSTGDRNVYVGCKAGFGNTTGSYNSAFGLSAGPQTCGATGSGNLSIGYLSGKCISSAECNISIGQCAACCLSTGGCNVAIGQNAGRGYSTASNNVSIGQNSGAQNGNSSGSGNITLGQVGQCISSGSGNIAIGCGANMGTGNVTGDSNISMGPYTGRRLTSGSHNTFISGSAGRYTTTGTRNVFIGIFAGYCNVSGGCNVAIGCNAGRSSAAAFDNISMGRAALYLNEIGGGNVAIGHSSSHGVRGSNNVSIGATSGPANSCTDTHDNVFIGSRTGTAYTGGCNIIAIGINAGASSCCAAFGCNNIHIGQNTGCKTQSGDNNITIGCRAGRNLTTGRCNIFMGLYAGGTVSTASGIVAIGNRTAMNATNSVIAIGCCAGGQFGGGSAGGIFIGRCAGRYANASDSSNIVMGGNAGRSLTCGLNIIIGSGAAYPATTACRNIGMGGQSHQKLTTGDGNLAFGTFALTGNTTGCCNIAIGDRSGAANCGATGSCNVTISVGSGNSLTTGSDNIFVGTCSGYGVTSGYKNIAIGLCAGYGHGDSNVAGVGVGTDNVFIGSCAGRCVATASRNVFIGREAGQRINDGCYNVAIGDQAGCCMMSGDSNTVVGSFAAYHLCSGSANTYLGLQAALCATTGSQNTIIGNTAGKTMTTGGSNVAVGHFAGCTLGSGGGNVMMGNCAGYRSSGSHNVMLGHSSGWDRLGSKFKYNVLIGSHAGYSRGTLPDGSMDVLIGFYAGACYTGTCSIGIGHSVRIPITDGSNQLAIGQLNDYWITGTCDYNVGIGTTKPIAKLDVNVGSSVSAFNIQGSEGQLFSVTNNLSSGSIFAVNDITGLPSIDVDADGTIQLAPRGTSEFVGIGTTVPTSKLHIVANNNDAAFKVGTALTVTGAGHVTFSGVTTFRGNNNPHGRGAIHLPYNCMLVFGDSYLRGAIYNTGAQLVFQALNTYRFRAWDGGGMQDWMNVNGPGGSVKIGGCHMGVSGSTNKTHSFITQPHKITMCSGVPDSATQTKRFELDSYGFNFTGITTVTGNLNVTGIATATKFDGAVQCNIVMGCNAGIAITAGCSVCSNVLIGRCAGNSIESSSRNVIIGCGAGICLNDGGGSNTFIGDQAGHYMGRCGCATNTGNTFLGHSAGKHVVNSCHAVAIGYQAAHGVGGSKFFASHTINIGCRAGCKMEGGHSIINIGRLAGASNSGGTFNINMGYQAGFNNLTGGNNFYGGYLAGFCNKTGGSNIAIGQNTFKCGTSGTTNIFMLNATGCNSNGHSNIAMGYIAFRCNSSGSHNIALGACAMRGCDTPANGTGCCNIFLGKATGCYISAGNKNTVVGVQAGYGITTGSCNVILGVDAGSNLTSNTHNVVIGPFANVPSGCSGTLTIGCCTMNWITGFNDGSVTINHGNANASGLLRISKNGNGAAELRFDTASTNTANVYLGDDEQLRIRYGATEHTRFASSGSVGIGTASPRTKLHVEGSVHASRFFQNPTALDTTVTFPESGTAVNGGVYGPYTINSGVTLTISDGSTFTVV